jgi:hypothetical protein
VSHLRCARALAVSARLVPSTVCPWRLSRSVYRHRGPAALLRQLGDGRLRAGACPPPGAHPVCPGRSQRQGSGYPGRRVLRRVLLADGVRGGDDPDAAGYPGAGLAGWGAGAGAVGVPHRQPTALQSRPRAGLVLMGPAVFESVRDSLSAAAATWTCSMSAFASSEMIPCVSREDGGTARGAPRSLPGAGPAWDGGVMVSDRQRVARMRRVALRALDAYPLVDREVRFVADGENTTSGSMRRPLRAVTGSCSACTARHAMGGMSTRQPRSVLNWAG